MRDGYFDNIAMEHGDSKLLPFRKYVETYSLFQITGDITGLNILELGCGEGFYTRKLKEAGAEYVTGVDASHAMIDLAQACEDENPIGCFYVVHNLAALSYLESFDLVVAMYLLNNARSKKELFDFCKTAYINLQPGGQFIGFNDNVSNNISRYETYLKYGFTKQGKRDRQEGDPIRYTFYNRDGSTSRYNNYYLHPETYVEAFWEAGFVDFQWIDPILDPCERNERYWDHFMDYPPIMGFSARKVQ